MRSIINKSRCEERQQTSSQEGPIRIVVRDWQNRYTTLLSRERRLGGTRYDLSFLLERSHQFKRQIASHTH